MEKTQKFPTEVVDLPSRGKLYPPDSPLASGTIEMKYMAGIINIGAYGHQQDMFDYIKTFKDFSAKKIDEHYVWAIKK